MQKFFEVEGKLTSWLKSEYICTIYAKGDDFSYSSNHYFQTIVYIINYYKKYSMKYFVLERVEDKIAINQLPGAFLYQTVLKSEELKQYAFAIYRSTAHKISTDTKLKWIEYCYIYFLFLYFIVTYSVNYKLMKLSFYSEQKW